MRYIVYQHRTLSEDKVFYVGISKKETRPYEKDKDRRSKFWNRVVNKYGFKVEIITYCDTLEEACEIERYLIKYYGRRDLGLGYLVNMTDGGEPGAGTYSELNERIRVLKISITKSKSRGCLVKTYSKKQAELNKLLTIQKRLPKLLDSYEHKSRVWLDRSIVNKITGDVYKNIYEVPINLHYKSQDELKRLLLKNCDNNRYFKNSHKPIPLI